MLSARLLAGADDQSLLAPLLALGGGLEGQAPPSMPADVSGDPDDPTVHAVKVYEELNGSSLLHKGRLVLDALHVQEVRQDAAED